jgi:hypothetical protein
VEIPTIIINFENQDFTTDDFLRAREKVVEALTEIDSIWEKHGLRQSKKDFMVTVVANN